MNFFKRLLHNFETREPEPVAVSGESQCPVCWGFQEYDQEIRIIHKDRLKDVTNKSFKFMRIQRLLREQIGGVRSKNNIRISRKRKLSSGTSLLRAD